MSAFGLAQATALTGGRGIGRPSAIRGCSWAACTAFAALTCTLILPSGPARREARDSLERTLGAPAAIQFARVAYGAIISFIGVVARDLGAGGGR